MKAIEPELFDGIKEELKQDMEAQSKKMLDEWSKKSIEQKFEKADLYRDVAERAIDWYITAGYVAAALLAVAGIFLIYSNSLRFSARIDMLEFKLNAAS